MNSTNTHSFTQEEQDFIEEYNSIYSGIPKVTESDLSLYQKTKAGDAQAKELLACRYMPEVLDIAKQFARDDIFLGDLVQEGNLGLTEALNNFSTPENAHEEILHSIEKSIRVYLMEEDAVSEQDNLLIEKVREMDEALNVLKEDLGRKVYVEEIADYMKISEEEVLDILKLTGEEISTEEDSHEHQHNHE